MPQFKLKIAGYVCAVSALFESTPYYLGRYCTDGTEHFSVVISREDLERERRFRDEEALAEGMKLRLVTEPFLERLTIQRKFADQLMDRGVLMVHGSAVAVDGVGYVFTAACGTGKSTHTRLWRQAFGDRAVMINDDKPFIRITQDQFYVCGSPWSGKHGLDTNIEVPLGGICLLERGVENVICPATPEERPAVCKELRWFMEPEWQQVFDTLAFEVMQRVPLWRMRCNMDPEAAEVSHSAMVGISGKWV